ncbi:MAG: hypothetical protein EHM45_24120, partial [Desulfobacteraceae bacterium]
MLKILRTSIAHSIKKWCNHLFSTAANPALLFRALGPFLILVIITIISYLTVDIIYKIAGLTIPARSVSAKSKAFNGRAAQTSGPKPASGYDVIAQRNLFLTTQKAIADKSTKGFISTGEEYTAFDLRGTIAVDDDFGFIVVEEKGRGKQKLYRIGEMVGSAKLVRITRSAAILNSGGRELVMRIEETKDSSHTTRPLRFGSSQTQSGITM